MRRIRALLTCTPPSPKELRLSFQDPRWITCSQWEEASWDWKSTELQIWEARPLCQRVIRKATKRLARGRAAFSLLQGHEGALEGQKAFWLQKLFARVLRAAQQYYCSGTTGIQSSILTGVRIVTAPELCKKIVIECWQLTGSVLKGGLFLFVVFVVVHALLLFSRSTCCCCLLVVFFLLVLLLYYSAFRLPCLSASLFCSCAYLLIRCAFCLVPVVASRLLLVLASAFVLFRFSAYLLLSCFALMLLRFSASRLHFPLSTLILQVSS